MEGGEENPLSEIMENSPNFWLESTPSLTSIDSLLSAQNCDSSQNQLSNTVTNNPTPLSQPSGISDFSVVSEYPTPQDQTAEFINELLNEYLDPNSVVVSSDGDKETEKDGSSNTWFKGHWRKDEDSKLISLVEQHGERKWAVIAKEMPGRIGKQCRERWQNHLRPNIKKKLFWTDEEERMIIEAHERFGNRWAEIAKCVPERSENAIKNHWNATKRKLNSKRRIKRPQRLQGLVQSTVLEEYIKKMYFNKRSTSSSAATTIVTHTASAPPSTTTINFPPANPHDYDNDDSASYFIIESNINEEMNVAPSTPDVDDDDDESMCYFTSETVDEEMNFMRNLFENNGNYSNEILNASSNGSSSINFSNISSQMSDVQLPMENVGNGLIASFSEANMEEIDGNRDNIPMDAAQDYAYFNPEEYFEGSLDNMGSKHGLNQDTSAAN